MYFLLAVSFATLLLGLFVTLKPNYALTTQKEEPAQVKPQPEVSMKISPTPLSLQTFQYPNSQQAKGVDKTLTFESEDAPSVITDWYKEKIKAEGLNTTSFVQTNTNGNILNKLAGANSQKEIQVEITKKSDSPKVTIVLTDD